MISIAVVITTCVIILFYFMVARYAGFKQGWATFVRIIRPFIIGFTMAFLMNPVMKALERRMRAFFLPKAKTKEKERKYKRAIRMFCSIVSLIFLVGVVTLFMVALVPEIVRTVQYLINNIEQQIYGILDWANEITGGHYEKEINGAKNAEALKSALDTAVGMAQNYLNMGEQEEFIKTMASFGFSMGRLLVDIILGMIVAVYVLLGKETFKGQGKKIIYGVFSLSVANELVKVVRKTNELFYGFIIGKIIDSTIIGFICYVSMVIMGMPYRVLCSVIIGVTNIIPIFGPYFGAVPTVIIIFLTNPWKGIIFLIYVFILQQVDGNIIGPKILGDSTGISSFWVVVAIVIGGGLFGLPGMILGVPMTALLYYLFGRLSKRLLRKKNLPEETAEYIYLKEIDEKTKTFRMKDPGVSEDPVILFKKKKKKDDGEGI